MDKPALQTLLWETQHARVPDDDPVWLIPTLVEAYVERIEKAASRIEASKAPLSGQDFDRLVSRLDKRFAARIVQSNRMLVLYGLAVLVLACGLTAGACWWVFAPGPCVVQGDLARGCYVRGG